MVILFFLVIGKLFCYFLLFFYVSLMLDFMNYASTISENNALFRMIRQASNIFTVC